jgi:hypothetical protein
MSEILELNDGFLNFIKDIYTKCLDWEKDRINKLFESIEITPQEFYDLMKEALFLSGNNYIVDLTNDGTVNFMNKLYAIDYSEDKINKIVEGFSILPNLQNIVNLVMVREFGNEVEQEIHEMTTQVLTETKKNVLKRFNKPDDYINTEEYFNSESSLKTPNINSGEKLISLDDARLLDLSKAVYSEKLTESEMSFYDMVIEGKQIKWLGNEHTWSYLLGSINAMYPQLLKIKGKSGIYTALMPFFIFNENVSPNFDNIKASRYSHNIKTYDADAKSKKCIDKIINSVKIKS